MRINTKGHMVFFTAEEAKWYAENAGFTVADNTASRPDMDSHFTLQSLARGNREHEYMWYRPHGYVKYS